MSGGKYVHGHGRVQAGFADAERAKLPALKPCAGGCGATIEVHGHRKFCRDCAYQNRLAVMRENARRRKAKEASP